MPQGSDYYRLSVLGFRAQGFTKEFLTGGGFAIDFIQILPKPIKSKIFLRPINAL